MSYSTILLAVAACLLATAGGVASDPGASATLIVVASGGTESAHEFLVLRATGESVTWEFIEPRGYTTKGLDPAGKAWRSGTVPGNSKMLTSAFQDTLGDITEPAQPPRGNQQRVPFNFSLILLDPAGVKTCQLWSGKQRRRLVDGDHQKPMFSEIRKKVYGKAIMMPDLLRVGMAPDLAEPKFPVPGGPEGKRPPPSPPSKRDR